MPASPRNHPDGRIKAQIASYLLMNFALAERGDSNPQLSGNFALQGICYYRLYYRELSEFTSEAPRSPAKLQEAQKMAKNISLQ